MPLHIGDEIDLVIVPDPLLSAIIEYQTQECQEAKQDDGNDAGCKIKTRPGIYNFLVGQNFFEMIF